jgi:hypothetical protein
MGGRETTDRKDIMFANRSTWIALGLVVAAVAAPAALADAPLAAKTEAAGFTAITQYLVQHAAQSDSSTLAAKTEAKGFLALQPKPVDVAQLGAQTEAKGYRRWCAIRSSWPHRP